MGTQTTTHQPTTQDRLKQVEEKQKQQQEELSRLQKFAYASNELSAFQSAVMAKAESWMSAARNVGSAYKMAAEKYKQTLKDNRDKDAARDDLMFSILSVAAVGAISWLSSAIQARTAKSLSAAENRLAEAKRQLENIKKVSPDSPQFRYRLQSQFIAEDRIQRLQKMPKPIGMIVETAEDSLQSASDKAISTYASLLTDADLVDPDPSKDPQVFQNEEQNKVSDVKQLAFQTFSDIRMDWQNKPLDFWDKYDVRTQEKSHAEWQREASTLAGKDDLLPVQQMADELERGFWKKHILDGHDNYAVGDLVFQRLMELDVVRLIPGGPPTNPLDTPAKLVNWAIYYQVRPLLKNVPYAMPSIGGPVEIGYREPTRPTYPEWKTGRGM